MTIRVPRPLFDPDAIRTLPSGLEQILTVMAALRAPDGGCPWDLEQTPETIAPYTIEEAYEVRDAIQNGDDESLTDELGDLLLQVVYQAQFGAERGAFDFDLIARGVAAKMVRRHPHVFGDRVVENADAQTAAWEAQKAEERAASADTSALAGVISGLPALMRAEKLSKRAARTGFDWPDTDGVYAKIDEELAEIKAAPDAANEREEIGDLLFTVVNLARKLGHDPEEALRLANDKFERRFRVMEVGCRDGSFADASPEELEAAWQVAKQD